MPKSGGGESQLSATGYDDFMKTKKMKRKGRRKKK